MVQPKVFLWEPAWIPWWLHFKKPSKLFRSCCNIPIRATTIIHYRLFHSNFPVSSFFLLVVKSFRGNIELHWPPPTPTAKTVLAVREVWLPGLKFLQKTPHKTNQKNNKTKKNKNTTLTPHFSRLSSCSAYPGSANTVSNANDAHRLFKAGRNWSVWTWNFSVSCFKKKKKILSSVMKMSFFSLLLIHVTVHFMLLRKKCENKKETKVCNFKLESEVHQTNKQKKKQPTGFSWVGMSLYQLQGCPHPDLTEGMRGKSLEKVLQQRKQTSWTLCTLWQRRQDWSLISAATLG